jgi:Xaa-Pro aminopeptidase
MKTGRSRTGALAIAGVPEFNADLLYASGYSCPDPSAWFRIGSRSYLLVNDLELPGARRLARAGSVVPLSRYYGRLRHKKPAPQFFFQAFAEALKERGVKSVEVPQSFPAGAAGCLAEAGIRCRSLPDPFLPRRSMKTPAEVRHIVKALRAAEAGLATAVLALAAGRIGRDGYIHLNGRRLTAEILRESAERAMFAAGAVPVHTIVAGGLQGRDPHAKGSGPLPANRPIVLDFFPRSRTSGYYGDITRTVVKGRADSRTRAAFLAVQTAQEMAIGMIRAGVDGSAVHSRIRRFFEKAGFPSRGRGAHREGFIHGTGHGLGLELHEHPTLGNSSCPLAAGHVITVEPGLYYREMGGIRLEDVLLVTPRGHRKLTRFPTFLEIG